MRKVMFTLMASIICVSTVSAFWPEATDSSLEFGVGYRKDRLSWKTRADVNSSGSGSGSSSSSSSSSTDADTEVTTGVSTKNEWRDLDIWQIEARGNYVTCDNIYFRASADYGWVTHGRHTAKAFLDFSGAGSNEESINIIDFHSKAKGHVYDLDLAVGYQFKMCDDSFTLTPVIGYSWKGQQLKRSNGGSSSSSGSSGSSDSYYGSGSYYSYSDVSSYSNNSGSGSSSSSNKNRFDTRWNGPFLGLDFDYRFWCDWSLFAGYEFHWATYHAKGRTGAGSESGYGSLDSFHQRVKNAYGNKFDIGVKWDFCECWTLALRGDFQYFTGKHGRDSYVVNRDSLGDIKTQCKASIPLRDVDWHSESITVDIGMVF